MPSKWRNGVLADLGTLPGGNCSNAVWINTRGGMIALVLSEIGEIDPVFRVPGDPCCPGRHGQIMDLGTFGGNESYANVGQ